VTNAYVAGEEVVLVSREGERRVLRRIPAEHVCFLRSEDVPPELERKLAASRSISAVKREGEWIRLRWRARELLETATRKPRCPNPVTGVDCYFDAMGLRTYEADVHPVRRYLTEHPVDIQAPRVCFLDLETDSRLPFSKKEQMRILCWAVTALDGTRECMALDEDRDSAERMLLQALWKALDRYDLVAAWNGDGFDFPVLKARTIHAALPVRWAQWLWLDQMELYRRMNMHVSESGEEKESVALARVASNVLGEAKDPFDASKTWEAWEEGGAERARLKRYNLRDAELLALIEEKTGYVDLHVAICQACSTFPDSHGTGTNFVEGFLLRRAFARGMHFRTQWDRSYGEQIAGALVLEPTKRGILRDVHVADFSALYPSVIQTWNISPETIAQHHVMTDAEARTRGYDVRYLKRPERPANVCEVPGYGACFHTDRPGLLAEAVTELRRLRKQWSDLQATFPPGTREWQEAKSKSNAYKVAANTCFGVVSSRFSRFFDEQVGEAITQGGVALIRATIEAGEERGLATIFCDTDSAFVQGGSDGQFRAFVDWCNAELYPRITRESGCKENHIELAYEKKFDVLVLCAKKRYCARYAHFKGKPATVDSKPEIKGLEYKRGDCVRLARKMQAQAIDLLLGGGVRGKRREHCEDDPALFEELVQRWRWRVLEGELELRDVVQSKSLSRELRGYAVKIKKDGTAAAEPVHVQVARVLHKRGREVGAGVRIAYVVTDASGNLKAKAAEDYQAGDEDRYYLWESLVYPPTQRLLEAAFPGGPWRRYESAGRPKPAPKPRAAAKLAAAPKPKRAANPGQGTLFG
jgi:DNA polymerase elongation subunit (family B)